MLFRNKCSPYQGKTMTGQVRETWLRGQRIFARGEAHGGFVGKECSGQLLLEPRVKELKKVKSWFKRWVYDGSRQARGPGPARPAETWISPRPIVSEKGKERSGRPMAVEYIGKWV